MTRFTTLCLLFLTVMFGRPTAILAEEQPERLFFQAEAMATEGEAWVVGKHFPNWYTGVPLEEMLAGSKGGQGQAVQELNIPAKGVWRLWVRYIDYNTYRGAFRLTVLQDEKECGHKIFDRASLRADEEGRKKWGGAFGLFVWDFVDAKKIRSVSRGWHAGLTALLWPPTWSMCPRRAILWRRCGCGLPWAKRIRSLHQSASLAYGLILPFIRLSANWDEKGLKVDITPARLHSSRLARRRLG